MAYTHKPNSGSVFKNTRMREGKQDPTWTGTSLINGVEYWTDLWINNHPKDANYNPEKKTSMSLKFREKQDQAAPREQQAPTRHSPPPPPPDDEEPEF